MQLASPRRSKVALFAAFDYPQATSIPFFQHLVALTGALTSAPLTLLLPCVFYRSAHARRRGGLAAAADQHVKSAE